MPRRSLPIRLLILCFFAGTACLPVAAGAAIYLALTARSMV